MLERRAGIQVAGGGMKRRARGDEICGIVVGLVGKIINVNIRASLIWNGICAKIYF
jgi:hypothetical protein